MAGQVVVIVAPAPRGRFLADVIDPAASRPGQPVILARVTAKDILGAKVAGVEWAKENGREIMSKEDSAKAIRAMMKANLEFMSRN